MPIASETVPNKALSGAELRAIILERFKVLLANDCMLADHLAYGRVSYDITLRLMVDNPFTVGPLLSTISSQPVGRNIIETGAPELAALESGPPLKEPLTKEATISGTRVKHDITSPNKERLTAGLPVPVDVRQRDGSVVTEKIAYPVQVPDTVEIEDITAQTRAELGAK